MVSVLYSGSSSPASSLGWIWLGHCIVVFALIVPLFTKVSNEVQGIFFLGDEQVPTSFMQGRVEILLVASCYRNRDKLQHDRPLGSNADFSNFILCLNVRESRDILRELEPACCNAYAQAYCTGQFVLPVLGYFRHCQHRCYRLCPAVQFKAPQTGLQRARCPLLLHPLHSSEVQC